MEPEQKPSSQKPVCSACGSDEILCDAYAEWDQNLQEWTLQNTFEQTVCNGVCGGVCGGECSIEWVPCA